MNATMITRDEAKEQARARLTEVLAEVVPGFRPERAFRCLNPNHEDRHPSMRYLPRSNAVRCFSCGWMGDVFDAVGAVYGLAGGDAFAKVYDMLGLDPKGGSYSRPAKPPRPKPEPGTWDEIISLIYPAGWDAPKPEVKLPLPLKVIAEAECGLVGRLALDPEMTAPCIECGLSGWHFDDSELGELFDDIRFGRSLDDYAPEFLEWITARAAPAHMARRLARFVVCEGWRRSLSAAFAAAYSNLQNQEPPDMVLEDILNQAELVFDRRFDMPAQDDAAMRETVADMFRRFHDGGDAASIVERFRRAGEFGATV